MRNERGALRTQATGPGGRRYRSMVTTMQLVQLRDLDSDDRVSPDSALPDAPPAGTTAGLELGTWPIDLPNVFAALPEGVLVVGAEDGTVWAANEAARRLVGRSALAGLRLADVVCPTHIPRGEPCSTDAWLIARALRGETTAEVELTIRRPEEGEVAVRASASPFRGSSGNVVGVVLTLRSLAGPREADRVSREHLTRIVHESRGALTAILGCVGLLESLAQEPVRPRKTPGYVDSETRFLGMIKADVWQLHTMLSELLDVSCLGGRDVKLDRQPVDLVSLVDDLVGHLAPNTGTLVTGHRIAVSYRRLAPIVDADPARLDQVLSSLLMTAARYSPPGTEIAIVIEPGADVVSITVSSKAGGIPKDELSRLFDQFLPRQDLRQEYRGLNSSLLVARGLVEAHGGEIWAESKPGRGVTFRFTLPLRRPR